MNPGQPLARLVLPHPCIISHVWAPCHHLAPRRPGALGCRESSCRGGGAGVRSPISGVSPASCRLSFSSTKAVGTSASVHGHPTAAPRPLKLEALALARDPPAPPPLAASWAPPPCAWPSPVLPRTRPQEPRGALLGGQSSRKFGSRVQTAALHPHPRDTHTPTRVDWILFSSRPRRLELWDTPGSVTDRFFLPPTLAFLYRFLGTISEFRVADNPPMLSTLRLLSGKLCSVCGPSPQGKLCSNLIISICLVLSSSFRERRKR